MARARSARRLALPLGLQQLGLIVGALIVAQIVTLALTVLIPPSPPQRWEIERVARALLGSEGDEGLERVRMAGPPDLSQAGWLVSETSRAALAKRLNRPVSDVVLAFYTQLPVGGVTVPAARFSQMSAPGDPALQAVFDSLVGTAHAQAGPGGGPPPGGMPGGSFPGGGFPRGTPPGGLPGGGNSGHGNPSSPSRSGPGNASPGNPASTGPVSAATSGPSAVPGGSQLSAPSAPPAGGPLVGGPSGTQVQGTAPPTTLGQLPNAALPASPAAQIPSLPTNLQALPAAAQTRPIERGRGPSAEPSRIRPESSGVAPTPSQVAAQMPSRLSTPASTAPRGTPQPIPFRKSQGGLSFVNPPFIEGDFIASMRQADGSWIAVAPRAEPFPNSWQRRVILWFALSLLLVAPFTWLFSRRIVKPLEGFARAAETLGRDPAASVVPLSGPAEIGRAARAFNQMRDRLRAFVDDRTAMVGAISHDLRTPLTRMRFRLEDVPDAVREELLEDVDEMELMISQVIAFIRDASTPGPRERIDFSALVESAVASARVTGSDVQIEAHGAIPVEVDPIGIRRVLTNLIENAVKYGERAHVRIRMDEDLAVADIIDAGPGIPEDERERAFEPFFRCEEARESEKPGSGLGLAVCRSIARAHGGDVRLEQREEGFVASLALPSLDGDLIRKAA